MKRIILVGCGKTKRAIPTSAKRLYCGPLFSARRRYAEESGHRWFVLSAKYGVIPPDDVVSPYDVTISDLSPIDRAAWTTGAATMLFDQMSDDTYPSRTVVEIHAGSVYAVPLGGVLRTVGFDVRLPLSGKGIGQQLSWYKGRRK